MSRAPQTFKQGDLAKVIKAAAAAGREVKSITVDRDGNIKVKLISSKEKPVETSCQNEWDEVLKNK
jgi:hypothetical protein